LIKFLSLGQMVNEYLGIDPKFVLPSIISSIVLILLFVAGRFLDSFIERKKNSQEWYMKMVLEPNSDTIHNFFQNMLDLSQQFSNILEQDNSIDNKSNLFNQLAQEKRHLEFNFLILVSKPYPKTSETLLISLNSIYDLCVNYLDEGDYTSFRFEKLEKEISTHKGNFFNEIYNPFRIKSTTKWLKDNYLWIFLVLIFLFFFFITIANSTRADKNNGFENYNNDSPEMNYPKIKQG